MKRKIMKSVAACAVLSMAVAACSSTKTTAGGTSSGKTLVVDDTPLSPMTDTFNPYSATSTGGPGGVTAQGLYNEPLFIWNILNPSESPFDILGTGYSWSNNGKTLTINTRSGVKWNDGKTFSASDVAFTFNMIRMNPGLDTNGTPVPSSASATSSNTVVLNFSAAEYANMYLIGGVYIVPQHIWANVNPVSFADPNPVGTGPYMLDHFSPQGFTLKENPNYWNKSAVHVPEISYPSYNANYNITTPLAAGQIDLAGNDIANVQNVYLGKSADNHTWTPDAPYLVANNVVGLFFNVTKAPLNDAAVRQAVSYGINRQQLATQGETGYEQPETSTSGLLLPRDQSWLSPSLANNLPATGDPSKVTSILTADGWKQVNGKWTKNGQTISFSISDPTGYTDYYLDAQDIAKQLNTLGFNVTVNGIGNPSVWSGDVSTGNFQAAIHWSNQGPTPYQIYAGNLDSNLTAPIGKPAATNIERWIDPATQAALAQYASSNDPSTQMSAITAIENIMTNQVPVAPLLYGAAWYEYSTRNYTGFPSASNPFNNPSLNSPFIEETILHLRPAS
jgi:peptide/nickel transport system substrate-binding protein